METYNFLRLPGLIVVDFAGRAGHHFEHRLEVEYAFYATTLYKKCFKKTWADLTRDAQHKI